MTWIWAHSQSRAPEIPEELCWCSTYLRRTPPARCTVPVNCHPPTVNLYRKREPEHHNESDKKSGGAACFCITLTHWQVVSWNMENPSLLPSPGPAVGNCDSSLSPCFSPSEVAASVLMQVRGIAAALWTFVLIFFLFCHLQFTSFFSEFSVSILRLTKKLSNSAPVLSDSSSALVAAPDSI